MADFDWMKDYEDTNEGLDDVLDFFDSEHNPDSVLWEG